MIRIKNLWGLRRLANKRAFVFWESFFLSFELLSKNFGALARCVLPVFALFWAWWWLFDTAGELDTELKNFPPLAGSLVNAVVATVILSLAEVKWARFILLSERPSWLPFVDRRAVGLYLWVFLVTLVAQAAALFLIGFLPLHDYLHSYIVIGIYSVLSTVVYARLSLGVPAAACGHGRPVRESLQLSRGIAGWRIVIALYLFALPNYLLSYFAQGLPPLPVKIIETIAVLLSVVLTGFLALVFHQLTSASAADEASEI